jgi:hypothetical protein
MGLNMPLKTSEVCYQEGVESYCINNWLRAGKLPEPRRDYSGHYLWGPADVENLRKIALTYKPRRRRQRGPK